MIQSSQEKHLRIQRSYSHNFSISQESFYSGLDITPLLGILYIADPKTLQEIMETAGRLEIIVKRGINYTARISIEQSQEVITCDTMVIICLFLLSFSDS